MNFIKHIRLLKWLLWYYWDTSDIQQGLLLESMVSYKPILTHGSDMWWDLQDRVQTDI